MNIRELAEKDLQATLEDKVSGFAVDVELTNLQGEKQIVQSQYHRVSVDIDPETGLQVKAKKSSVTVRNSSVLGIIQKGWKVSIWDINNKHIQGTVAMAPIPDNTLGITTFFIREEEMDD